MEFNFPENKEKLPVLRLLGPQDLPALVQFAEQTFRVAWQHLNDPLHFEDYCRDHFTLPAMQKEMEADHTCFYFAENPDGPQAYLKMNYQTGHPELDPGIPAAQLERIYVGPDFQGQGLGAGLIRFCESESRKHGAALMWLSVWKKAPRSIAFYQKMGYEIFGEETFWVGKDPQSDWLMKKMLNR